MNEQQINYLFKLLESIDRSLKILVKDNETSSTKLFKGV